MLDFLYDEHSHKNTWRHHRCPRFFFAKVNLNTDENTRRHFSLFPFLFVVGDSNINSNTWRQCSMSSFLLIKGKSNVDEKTWRHHTCPSFSLSKVIRIQIRIPEDVTHILVSLSRRWFEYCWEHLKTSYMSLFRFVEGDSNSDENTWRACGVTSFLFVIVIWISMRIPEDNVACPCFSWSQVIRMSMRMPDDTIRSIVSLCRRWFEY